MARQEYFHDDHAPDPNSVTPTAFAAVLDDEGRLLLVRRCDSGDWELPGGRVELGESVPAAAEREVEEESGVRVRVTRLAGVYSDPGHVLAYPDTGEVRQEFAVCVHAVPVDGEVRADREETCDSSWVDPRRLDDLPIHPSMRLRIRQVLGDPREAHLG